MISGRRWCSSVLLVRGASLPSRTSNGGIDEHSVFGEAVADELWMELVRTEAEHLHKDVMRVLQQFIVHFAERNTGKIASNHVLGLVCVFAMMSRSSSVTKEEAVSTATSLIEHYYDNWEPSNAPESGTEG